MEFTSSIPFQMKLYNRNFAVGERIEYMGWVNEGVINNNISWQTYKPRFLVLKGTEVMLFDSPPVTYIYIYITDNISTQRYRFQMNGPKLSVFTRVQ